MGLITIVPKALHGVPYLFYIAQIRELNQNRTIEAF